MPTWQKLRGVWGCQCLPSCKSGLSTRRSEVCLFLGQIALFAVLHLALLQFTFHVLLSLHCLLCCLSEFFWVFELPLLRGGGPSISQFPPIFLSLLISCIFAGLLWPVSTLLAALRPQLTSMTVYQIFWCSLPQFSTNFYGSQPAERNTGENA